MPSGNNAVSLANDKSSPLHEALYAQRVDLLDSFTIYQVHIIYQIHAQATIGGNKRQWARPVIAGLFNTKCDLDYEKYNRVFSFARAFEKHYELIKLKMIGF